MLFSIAMTFSRFVGDGIVARFGNRFVLTLGGMIALLGLCGLSAFLFAIVNRLIRRDSEAERDEVHADSNTGE